MASSSVRRRSVKFAERPPTIVRYSYHGDSNPAFKPSTSLFFSKLNEVMNQNQAAQKLRSREEPFTDAVCLRGHSSQSPPKARLNLNRHSSYEPTYANLSNLNYENAPGARHSSNNNNHLYDDVPTKKAHHKWSENYGLDTVDVVQKNNGITHVTIGDVGGRYLEEDEDESEEMAMHLYDCIDQFQQACDKILGARQMIDGDSTLTQTDRDKLLRLVNKSIVQGKARLENFDSSRTASSITAGSTTSMSSKLQSTSPSSTGLDSKIQIDNNFMNVYGPQIMQLLQHNMAKQN